MVQMISESKRKIAALALAGAMAIGGAAGVATTIASPAQNQSGIVMEAEAATVTGKVVVNAANIYTVKSNGSVGDKVDVLHRGADVTVKGKYGNYRKVSYSGGTAYIYKNCILTTESKSDAKVSDSMIKLTKSGVRKVAVVSGSTVKAELNPNFQFKGFANCATSYSTDNFTAKADVSTGKITISNVKGNGTIVVYGKWLKGDIDNWYKATIKISAGKTSELTKTEGSVHDNKDGKKSKNVTIKSGLDMLPKITYQVYSRDSDNGIWIKRYTPDKREGEGKYKVKEADFEKGTITISDVYCNTKVTKVNENNARGKIVIKYTNESGAKFKEWYF